MFTVVKSNVREITTTHDSFNTMKQLPSADAPRFDKIITNLSEDIRKRKLSQNRTLENSENRRMKSYFEVVDNKIGSRHRNLTPMRITNFRYDGPPLIETKTYKQEFLKGDGDAIYYCDKNEPKASYYQVSWKGAQTKDPAKILDHNRFSFVGNVIPDP